jgi:hypothetical protein
LPLSLELIAAAVLREARLGGPVDAYRLCDAAGFRVCLGYEGCTPTVAGDTVIVNPADPPERRRFAAAHELAHVLLRFYQYPDDEWSVNWLASALLLPRDWFLERLAIRGWDLAGLREDCPHSSYEAIGRRIVNLGGAVMWVCDRHPDKRNGRRWISEDAPLSLTKPTRREWDTVARVAQTGQPECDKSLGAWPLEARGILRVISLGRAADLAQSTR